MKTDIDLDELKEKLWALNDERTEHMQSLTHGEPMIHGMPYEVFRRCGKANCKCADGHRHGPYQALSINEGGKQKTILVRKKDEQAVRQKAERYRHFQQTLAKIRRINKEIDKLFEQLKMAGREPYP